MTTGRSTGLCSVIINEFMAMLNQRQCWIFSWTVMQGKEKATIREEISYSIQCRASRMKTRKIWISKFWTTQMNHDVLSTCTAWLRVELYSQLHSDTKQCSSLQQFERGWSYPHRPRATTVIVVIERKAFLSFPRGIPLNSVTDNARERRLPPQLCLNLWHFSYEDSRNRSPISNQL